MPLPYFPSALAFLEKLPVFEHMGLKRGTLGGVFLCAPSALCGFPVLTQGKSGLPVSSLAVSGGWTASIRTPVQILRFLVPLADISSKVCQGKRFPVGLFTLLANHHGISQPSTTSWRLASSSWCLLGHVSHRARWSAPLMSKGS